MQIYTRVPFLRNLSHTFSVSYRYDKIEIDNEGNFRDRFHYYIPRTWFNERLFIRTASIPKLYENLVQFCRPSRSIFKVARFSWGERCVHYCPTFSRRRVVRCNLRFIFSLTLEIILIKRVLVIESLEEDQLHDPHALWSSILWIRFTENVSTNLFVGTRLILQYLILRDNCWILAYNFEQFEILRG